MLSNTTDINTHIEFLDKQKLKGNYVFKRFLIDKEKLRKATYSSKGTYSRAILSLYSSKKPKDWDHIDRDVMANNFFFSTDKPNLHHIFPTNYIENNKGNNKLDNNSLMNIAYITQITNLKISDKNPLEYIASYNENPKFRGVLESHLLPKEIIKWAEMKIMPTDALDQFMEKRINIIINELKKNLDGIDFDIIDTRGKIKDVELL